MKQELYALQTTKGTFLYFFESMCVGNYEVEETDKFFNGALWENKQEALDKKKDIESGGEISNYFIDDELLPLKVRTMTVELEEDEEVQISNKLVLKKEKNHVEIAIDIELSEETMEEYELEQPYVVISLDKYGRIIPSDKYEGIIPSNKVFSKNGESELEIHPLDGIAIENRVKKDRILLEEAGIYQPRMFHDYSEKDGLIWVHVYDIVNGIVRFYIADKDRTNGELSIHEFMDKYNTRHPMDTPYDL